MCGITFCLFNLPFIFDSLFINQALVRKKQATLKQGQTDLELPYTCITLSMLLLYPIPSGHPVIWSLLRSPRIDHKITG